VYVAVNEKGHAGEALRVAQDRQLTGVFEPTSCTFGDRGGSQRQLQLAGG
jgi:hypothetical protein